MIVARFIVQGEERETREVDEQWLRDAWANRDNVLLSDGNPYRIVNVEYLDLPHKHARVEVAAPEFARGS